LEFIEATHQWKSYMAMGSTHQGGYNAIDLLSQCLVQAFVDLDAKLREEMIDDSGNITVSRSSRLQPW
jgi:hypothetical protein